MENGHNICTSLYAMKQQTLQNSLQIRHISIESSSSIPYALVTSKNTMNSVDVLFSQ